MKLPLQWKWFVALAIFLVALLATINVCVDFYLPPFLVGEIQKDLERNAVLAREAFAPVLAADPGNTARINELAHALSRQTGLRVTVIASDGRVLGESDRPYDELASIENHLQRPEVQAALTTGKGIATRHSTTVNTDMLYVAVTMEGHAPSWPPPNGRDGARPSVVRIALHLYQIAQTTRHVRRIVVAATVVVALAALPVLFWMARRPGSTIETIRETAALAAGGDLSARAAVKQTDELGDLGTALNEMTHQLQERVQELSRERAELDATLSNMIEGVLVVDATGRIRLANRALREQLQLPDSAVGKTVLEAFRNTALQDLIARALASEQTTAHELTFFGEEERVFDVNAARLRGPDGSPAGVVAVFHDITRLKRLENVRKEFVANVSHELRTPLAIIKGYVETLLDKQPPDAATARQFLQTIDKHSRRLEALITDLLSISELESQQVRLSFAPVSLRACIVEELLHRASDKKVTVQIDLPDLMVRADEERLRQVFTNLLDNAIKYTQPGGKVSVTARPTGGEVEVCVSDNGPGIAAEHLPRIFERFYRADRARSRELGGTGLGLSIVKHIVQAHGGRVWAESELEKGSRFYFMLPHA